MKSFKSFVLLMITLSKSVNADTYFEELWKKVEQNSFAVKASSESHKASLEELKMAKNHWLPNFYLQGTSFFTDDSGTNMFALLSQRKITNSDFSPSTLNDPGMNHFSKVGLGFQLPLYQGMAGTNYQDVVRHLSVAEEKTLEATEKMVFSEYFKMYSMLKTYLYHEESFQKTLSQLHKLESSYQLGSKENLLGYSGKLGIKNLILKTQSLLSMVQVKKTSILNALEELSGEKVVVKNIKESDFEYQYRNLTQKDFFNYRSDTEAFKEKSLAQQESVELQKARFRPQVSLFGEQSFFKGDRDTADNKLIGLNVQWSLFSKENLNLDSKSLYQAYAAKNAHLALEQRDEIDRKLVEEVDVLLNETFDRSLESKQFLSEQISVTSKLFKNGMINILQFLEVLNQEIVLNEKILELEEKRAENRAKKLQFLKEI